VGNSIYSILNKLVSSISSNLKVITIDISLILSTIKLIIPVLLGTVLKKLEKVSKVRQSCAITLMGVHHRIKSSTRPETLSDTKHLIISYLNGCFQ
jgi:phage-related protein